MAARPVRHAETVERIAYSIVQAAQALGVNPSTVSRSVVPAVEIIETESGQLLIPVGELERYVAERRRPVPKRRLPEPVGRPSAVPTDVARRIRAERAAGRTLGQIARGLDADRVPTAQNGRRWWPSSVRVVLLRSNPLPVKKPEPSARARKPPTELSPPSRVSF
jgi:hypothetical protein